jgi:hypothetical protein
MGYDDLKVIEAAGFLRSVAEGRPYGATVHDALAAARVLDAMAESVRTGGWVPVHSGDSVSLRDGDSVSLRDGDSVSHRDGGPMEVGG